MAKREKILLTLMIVAIGYGIFEFFSGYLIQERIVEQPFPQVENAFSFSSDVSQTVENARLVPTEVYIIDLAFRNTVPDFLYEWPPEDRAVEQKPYLSDIIEPMIYNGYLEMGSRRLAIIDGIEYQEGDILARGIFRILSISPQKVAIENLNNGSRIVIPYAEEF